MWVTGNLFSDQAIDGNVAVRPPLENIPYQWVINDMQFGHVLCDSTQLLMVINNGMSKQRWISRYHNKQNFMLSAEEERQIKINMTTKLLQSHRQVENGIQPLFVLTCGAPGSGKSSVAGKFTHDTFPGHDFATFDTDTVQDFHPRYNELFEVRDVATNNVIQDIGQLDIPGDCMTQLDNIMHRVFSEAIGKYHIILHTHNTLDAIVNARNHGYDIILLWVGTPLSVAKRRVRERVGDVRYFVSPHVVAKFHNTYLRVIPHLAMLVDYFVIISTNPKHATGPREGNVLETFIIQKADKHLSQSLAALMESVVTE